MSHNRRALITGLAATLLAPRRARAASVTDGAGRIVPVPARVERVFPAGPPAAVFLYTLSPALLLGWPRGTPPRARAILFADRGRRRPARGRPHHRARQHRQSRSRARAQTRSHPRRRQREPNLHLARRSRAAADGHSLRAARRPFRRHSTELPHARHTDRAARA